MSVTYNIEEKTKYVISNIERALESLFNQRNAIPTTEEEICYLESANGDLTRLFGNVQEKIKKRIEGAKQARRIARNFDVEKVNKLPSDVIDVIKSFIEPKVFEFTRKFSVCTRHYFTSFCKLEKQIAIRAMKKFIFLRPIHYYRIAYHSYSKRELIDELRQRFDKFFDTVEKMEIDKILYDWNANHRAYQFHNTKTEILNGMYDTILTFQTYLKYKQERRRVMLLERRRNRRQNLIENNN